MTPWIMLIVLPLAIILLAFWVKKKVQEGEEK